ncbi:hypothetical protein GCM10017556_03190 [Micromonospora sagamiensis]|nr:hypothetical protein GCM10017556_03190 [Micromonospora sagamiensis]
MSWSSEPLRKQQCDDQEDSQADRQHQAHGVDSVHSFSTARTNRASATNSATVNTTNTTSDTADSPYRNEFVTTAIRPRRAIKAPQAALARVVDATMTPSGGFLTRF